MHAKQHFADLRVSPAVRVGHDGLIADRDIQKYEIILSVRQDDAICYSTVPQSFRKAFYFLKNCKFTQATTNIQRPIDQRVDTLLFYLIYLKRWRRQQQIYKEWLSRPVLAMYYFDRQVIQQCQNSDLLINYVAERNHLSELTKHLYKLLGEVVEVRMLQMIFNCETVEYSVFKSEYEWSYHFVNNRSFGYTKQFTLIPIFDMMNHSSKNNNVCQVLTPSHTPLPQELQKLVQEQEQDSRLDSDNEDDQSIISVQTSNSHLDLYYHVVATQNINQGDEIFIKYGNRNNQFLLQGYGFVQQFNPYDSLTVFLDLASDSIYFDSVHSNSSPKFKFKRGQFNLGFFMASKQCYFSKYYKRQWKSAKVFWSVPKDIDFERQHAFSLLARMQKYCPVEHVLLGKGCNQMMLFERERCSIYRQQVSYIQFLLKCAQKKQEAQASQDSQKINEIPTELAQYCQLLLKL